MLLDSADSASSDSTSALHSPDQDGKERLRLFSVTFGQRRCFGVVNVGRRNLYSPTHDFISSGVKFVPWLSKVNELSRLKSGMHFFHTQIVTNEFFLYHRLILVQLYH